MKKLFLKLIIISLMSIIPLASYNYIIDPYGIFHNSSLNLWYEPGYEPNQHYAKMRHLINDKHSWDSYLFGSSRVGKINPDVIPNGHYYNMNYSEGILGEHLDDIKVLLKKGISVKNVIIGLDNDSYTIRPEDHRGQILRHSYDISDFKRILFQIKYLFFGLRDNSGRHAIPKKDAFLINFNIMGNGLQNLEKVDQNIERDSELHIRNIRFHKANIIPFDKASEDYYMKLMEDTIKNITEIIKLSREYHFNLHFFINPTHKLFYLRANPYHFLLFKEKLAQVTDYWDFSGFNTITTNNYYYYETSHYRTIVGDLIICRMINCTNLNVPKDFGVFITKQNVSQHIQKQKDELIVYNISNYKNDWGK